MFDLADTFTASVERTPQAVAISDAGVSWTFAQWHTQVLALAAALARTELQRADRVISVLQNRVEAATLHMACQYAGLVITPVNWRLTAAELDVLLADSGARAVVFESLTEPAVAAAAKAQAILRIGVGEVGIACTAYAALCDPLPSELPDHPGAGASSLMLYTSGTTGRAKGVPRTHAAERAATLAHIAQNQYGRGEVTLGVMPLYHTMGVRSLLASIMVNGHFVCQRRFEPEQALALIERYRVTNLYLVPTLYHDLLHAAGFATRDLTSVCKLGFAGQAMTDGLLKALDAAFTPELFANHYGSSEIYTFTFEPTAAAKPGSAGKAGLNQRIRVVTLTAKSAHELAAVNEEGQIIAAATSDEAFTGYWNRPDADAKALRSGWYFTGDIGFQDRDGDLFVTGRVDDMIVSGGENILPAEIESVLSLHASVLEVAVAGTTHERWGQVVTAFVVRRDDVDETALNNWCLASSLADFKRPRRYVFVQEIPRSPVGKVLRRRLVDADGTAS